MSLFVNAVNKTMGSALSVVWDYGKWMFGYGTDERNDGTGMSCATPFVFTRRSSLFIDEDGDAAHEFYVEVTPPNGRPWMKRITENLIEQGFVKLKYPRLHVDFPVALYEG
ncbi:tumor suppressor candidate 2-like [Rhopilema esculentum]|uniref:tumor suppressor candidate 2-like n=1 Tax=Rhopilema esculentum TaxID=499914 RepID=UPI0031D1E156